MNYLKTVPVFHFIENYCKYDLELDSLKLVELKVQNSFHSSVFYKVAEKECYVQTICLYISSTYDVIIIPLFLNLPECAA